MKHGRRIMQVLFFVGWLATPASAQELVETSDPVVGAGLAAPTADTNDMTETAVAPQDPAPEAAPVEEAAEPAPVGEAAEAAPVEEVAEAAPVAESAEPAPVSETGVDAGPLGPPPSPTPASGTGETGTGTGTGTGPGSDVQVALSSSQVGDFLPTASADEGEGRGSGSGSGAEGSSPGRRPPMLTRDEAGQELEAHRQWLLEARRSTDPAVRADAERQHELASLRHQAQLWLIEGNPAVQFPALPPNPSSSDAVVERQRGERLVLEAMKMPRGSLDLDLARERAINQAMVQRALARERADDLLAAAVELPPRTVQQRLDDALTRYWPAWEAYQLLDSATQTDIDNPIVREYREQQARLSAISRLEGAAEVIRPRSIAGR